VRGTILRRPFLHGQRHRIRHSRIEWLTPLDGGLQRFEDGLRTPLTHLVEREYVVGKGRVQVAACLMLSA
jgi:hypothetical protein